MASIIDSLVIHLQNKIISGNSQERISVEVLNEFMSDVATPPVQSISAPKLEPIKSEPEFKAPGTPVEAIPKAEAAAVIPPVQEAPKKEQAFTYTEGVKPEVIEIPKDVEGLSLDELRIHGNSCSACKFKLGEKRSKDTALNQSARLMIISEPSGRTDEHLLDPFHGEAGELFLKMVSAMKIDLNDLYICMAHKCFGPGAREKIVETKPFLEKQIELIRPEAILIFGGAALNILLGEQSLMKNRGKWIEVNGIPAIATFPPAYLQQKAEAKREAWNDMQQVMARLKL